VARKKKSEGIGSEFLSNYLEGRTREDLSKHTVSNDRWDRDDLDSVVKEMAAFKEARRQLGNFAPQSGESLIGDDFFAFVKGMPRLMPNSQIEPTHLINGMVMNEAMDLPEFNKVHPYTVGDPIQAAAAAAAMEPKLEEILDQMEDAQNHLQEMINQISMHGALQEQLDATEEQIAAIASGGEEQGDPVGLNPQEQKDLIEEQMRRLEQQMAQTAKSLDSELENAQPHVQQLLRQGMEQASDEAEATESAAIAWGLDPGGLKRLSPEKRIEIAEKLNSHKFRKIAELFGSMTRLAMAEQNRKVYHAADEIFDVETGDDLERMLISEGVKLAHPALRALWLRDYVESGLMQYKLQGVERVSKGSIILCEDGSGSMGGAREIWAKAVGLCLARICREQDRDFHAIHFGGTGELYEFDFRGSGFDGIVRTKYHGSYRGASYPDLEMTYIDGIVHFAEVFFNGGTDFVSPLSRALSIQQQQQTDKGRVDGDIVFVTDGQCGVSAEWLDQFKKEQERLNFRVWGVIIGSYDTSMEPLNTICDGRVFTVEDLTTGEELRDMFRNV
jgi:uncharacterized protein with von Willebrand factor type A (vWA) domain